MPSPSPASLRGSSLSTITFLSSSSSTERQSKILTGPPPPLTWLHLVCRLLTFLLLMVSLGQVPADTTVTAPDLVMVLLLRLHLGLNLTGVLHVYVDGDILLGVSVDEDIDVVDVDPHVVGDLAVADQLVDPLRSTELGAGLARPVSPGTAVHGLHLGGGVNVLAPALAGGVVVLHVRVGGVVLVVVVVVLMMVMTSVMTVWIMRMGMSSLLVMVFVMVTMIMRGVSPIQVSLLSDLLQSAAG